MILQVQHREVIQAAIGIPNRDTMSKVPCNVYSFQFLTRCASSLMLQMAYQLAAGPGTPCPPAFRADSARFG